jgi:hypothetical protein
LLVSFTGAKKYLSAAGIFLPKEGMYMETNFIVREKNIMAEVKPQILSLEDIIRQQELAKYGRAVSVAPRPKTPVFEGCLMPARSRIEEK